MKTAAFVAGLSAVVPPAPLTSTCTWAFAMPRWSADDGIAGVAKVTEVGPDAVGVTLSVAAPTVTTTSVAPDRSEPCAVTTVPPAIGPLVGVSEVSLGPR